MQTAIVEVGEHDREVLELNRQALARLVSVKELAVVPGATHLFEEPGTLEQAANLLKQQSSVGASH